MSLHLVPLSESPFSGFQYKVNLKNNTRKKPVSGHGQSPSAPNAGAGLSLSAGGLNGTLTSSAAAATTGRSPEKHHRILQAAIEVFAEHGYFNSRISDIAKKADVADGTIYLYFKNKEQILMAAIDFAFTLFMDAAQKEMAEISDPRQRLRRLAALHLESLGANRGLAMVFQTEFRQSAKFLAQFSHHRLIAYFDLVRAIVRDGQASGEFRKEVSDKIAANCFFGALDAMVTSWLLSERDYNLGAAADAIVDVILTGMETRG